MCWKLLKTLQVEPEDETDFPVRALTHFDVYTFILCSLGLCCEVFISLLPCGQLLMSSCLFEKAVPLSVTVTVFRLTVLPHTCSSLICRFSHDLLFPRHSRCSPHPPRLRPANWFISLSAVSAGLPSEERSCRGQTVCGCTCCRGELRCRPITQASSWAHSDDCAVDAVHHTHWRDRQLTKT